MPSAERKVPGQVTPDGTLKASVRCLHCLVPSLAGSKVPSHVRPDDTLKVPGQMPSAQTQCSEKVSRFNIPLSIYAANLSRLEGKGKTGKRG